MEVKFASFNGLHALKAAGKRKKHIIPCTVTLLNACCGFLSVVNSIEGNIKAAAYCIILAACMDMLDGRIARALRSTSSLGMELDSLADAVSFCVAPAVLLYSTYYAHMPIVGMISLSIYLCAGLSRLARFNIASVQSSSFFTGLPTPIAACCMAQFALQEEWLVREIPLLISRVHIAVPLFLGVLMVSNVPYPSFKHMSLKNQCIVGLLGLLVCIISVYSSVSSFAVGVWAYILFGWMLCVRTRSSVQ